MPTPDQTLTKIQKFGPDHVMKWSCACGELSELKAALAQGADPRSADGVQAMINATSNKKCRFVRALLQAGADPSSTDRNGETGLIIAVNRGDRASVEALLQAGADLSPRNRQGRDALAEALYFGADRAVIRSLIELEIQRRRALNEARSIRAVSACAPARSAPKL